MAGNDASLYGDTNYGDTAVKFIAHRGQAEHFPENTLLAFQAALEAGAHAVECDVQFSQDGQAYILHDANLLRTAGVDAFLSELNSDQLADISVHEASRFSGRYYPCVLLPLREFLALVVEYPQRQFFVEIKTEVFDVHERDWVVDYLVKVLVQTLPKHLRSNVIVISYDLVFLQKIAMSMSDLAIGWVLTRYDESSHALARQAEPDFLICNKNKLPDVLWDGPWQWAIYDVIDYHEAKRLQALGVSWIESWDVKSLLKQWRCHEL